MSSTPMKITTIDMETAKTTPPPRDGVEETSLRRANSTKSDVADPKMRRGFAAWARKVPYIVGICLVLGLCATFVVLTLDQREMKRRLDQLELKAKSDDAPRLPQPPRSGRTRRNPQDQDQDPTQNVFQLDGVKDGDKTDMKKVDYRGYITIADWSQASWLKSGGAWKDNFAMTADKKGIKVLHDGIYFVYANFPFTGTGSECSYKLHYGDEKRKCHWKSNGKVVANINQNHMCYLGFVTELKANDELKLVFWNDFCGTTTIDYRKRQHLSYMGIIKQS